MVPRLMSSLRLVFACVTAAAFAGCNCGDPRITTAFDAGCSAEVCNGLDDDCDGVVDDALPTLSCGVGACTRTIASCVDGQTVTCEAGAPVEETCNGLDDDCNGEVDDNIAPATCGVGACVVTMPACVGGVSVPCEPALPSAERCDGIDNDCDGDIDEALPDTTCGEGACARTVASCMLGLEQECVPGTPTTELCDGVDNNCDGQIDEGLPMLSCGVGACLTTTAACVSGQGQVCTPGTPTTERCDNVDNDCDGQVDEGLGPTTCGQGACLRTVAACVNGVAQACVPGTPTFDICDGIDNDCNGTIDDNGICSPPLVLCAGSVAGQVGADVTLTATALDLDGTIVFNRWTVAIKPPGSTAQPNPIDQPTTVFRPDAAGSYTLAFCARDNAGTTTCCSTTITTGPACTNPPAPPVSTACGTSWDGRPIVQFPAVAAGLEYQLRVAGSSIVQATATAGQNYLRPAARVAAGGPPPGTPTNLEVVACRSNELTCCSTPSSISVNVVESCTAPVPPTSSNLVISEYVVNGQQDQMGEAVELTNLSNCPIKLEGFHFAYRNPSSSPDSYRWMNFGPQDVIPPRGVYVAIRERMLAPQCAASLDSTQVSPAIFGLRISSLQMEGPNLQSGWFNNSGGGTSIMQVAPGVASATALDFSMPIAQVAPYVGGNSQCVGVGFDAVNSCGDFAGTTTPSTVLTPNQLGRLWHPCDALTSPTPACVRN